MHELRRAQRERYAIPLFDVVDMQTVEGVFEALEGKHAPAIIGVYAGMLDRPGARALAAYIQARAEEVPERVSLMLDHGGSVEQCLKAVSYGFTDVMYDGSQLSLAENIASTKAVVEAAHAKGVGIEAELGHVGSGSEYRTFGALRKGFTDPDAVGEFVAATGADCLAVAIGTAHGLYDGEPHLDLDLLQAIRERVRIPLALHGGTGCPEDQLRAAIAKGISKINVATDLFLTAGKHLVEAARTRDVSYFDLSRIAIDTFRERCGHYLDLFGAAGKG